LPRLGSKAVSEVKYYINLAEVAVSQVLPRTEAISISSEQ